MGKGESDLRSCEGYGASRKSYGGIHQAVGFVTDMDTISTL